MCDLTAVFVMCGMKIASELRQDIVSGDWVVIATGRAKRPDQFLQAKRKPFRQPKHGCPFESLSPNAVLSYSRNGMKKASEWRVEVIKNIYPAFGEGMCGSFYSRGPYSWTEGTGFHELVVTRNHDRSPGKMSDEEVELMIRAYQERFIAIKEDRCVAYISIFHNHGNEAGATIYHPHSQIIALPVIPPDVGRSFTGSERYFKKHHRCVHCVLLKYELRARERVIYLNKSFAVVAPYASKSAFEMRIFPIKHQPRFEEMSPVERKQLANALRVALGKLYQGLGNPDYNFFIHTSPVKHSGNFRHYHWHVEILPKTSIWAGFEIGTGIEISTLTPESAAAFLKRIRI